MSLECSECEHDLREGHDPSCSRALQGQVMPMDDQTADFYYGGLIDRGGGTMSDNPIRKPLALWQITLRLEPLTPLGEPTTEDTITVSGRGYIDSGNLSPERADWTLRWLDDPSGAQALLTVLIGGRQ